MPFKRKRTYAPRPLKRTRRMRKPMVVRIQKTRRRNRGTTRVKSGIVPDRKRVTMRYYFTLTQDISSLHSAHVFHANGIFDPDVSGVGHQPRGHDQYGVLYDDYVVLGSKITINGFSPGNAEPWLLAVSAEESATGTSIIPEDVVELPGGRFSFKSAYKETHKNIKSSVSVAKFLNRSGGLQDDSDLVAAFGSSPTTPIYWRIVSIPVGAGASATVKLIGWIDYRVMLLNPTKVQIS